VVGFSILAFSHFIPAVLFGLFTGLAIAMALLAALTLLPAMIIWIKPFGPDLSSPPSSTRRSLSSRG